MQGGSGLDLDAASGSKADFLARERAALGDEAGQLATPHDSTATAQDDEGDLLGGGGAVGAGHDDLVGGDVNDFERDFPAVEARNQVRARRAGQGLWRC